jgi:hypothetical protein
MLSFSEEERDFCKYDDVVVMAIDHFVDKEVWTDFAAYSVFNAATIISGDDEQA